MEDFDLLKKEQKIEIKSKQDLEMLLSKHKIDFKSWDTTQVGVKSIDDLFKEIIEKDCFFIENNGELIRKLNVLAIRVFYSGEDGKLYFLKESKQVFTQTGKSRERRKWSSVGEKLKTDERPNKDAVSRALGEELQIFSGYDVAYKDSVKNTRNDIQSFPGIRSEFMLHRFEVYLKPESYKKEGYVEQQNNLVTYFTWEVYDPVLSEQE